MPQQGLCRASSVRAEQPQLCQQAAHTPAHILGMGKSFPRGPWGCETPWCSSGGQCTCTVCEKSSGRLWRGWVWMWQSPRTPLCHTRAPGWSRLQVWSSFPAPRLAGNHRVSTAQRAKGGAESWERAAVSPPQGLHPCGNGSNPAEDAAAFPDGVHPRHTRPWDTDLFGFVTKHSDTSPVPWLGE